MAVGEPIPMDVTIEDGVITRAVAVYLPYPVSVVGGPERSRARRRSLTSSVQRFVYPRRAGVGVV